MENEREINSVSSKWKEEYTNFVHIGHNAFEFLLEFGESDADGENDVPHTRLVTNPVFAVRLAMLLRQAIAQYERRFGSIPADDDMRK